MISDRIVTPAAAMIAALLVAVTTLALSDRHDPERVREPGMAPLGEGIAVAWAQPSFDLRTLVRRSEAVVVADVIATRDVPQAPSDELHGPPPVQHVLMRTVESLRGSMPASFLVYKTASPTFVLEGDPPYEAGERYVLFVHRREDAAGRFDGTYLVNLPDGRYLVGAEGLRPTLPGPVQARLRGLQPADLRSLLTR